MKRKRLIVLALGAGALGFELARRSKAAKERSLSVADTSSGREGPFGVVEVDTEEVDADDNLVVDELLVAVDSDGTIVATDETIAVITPEGNTVVDEKLSVMGDDGELHTVEEDISLMEDE
jgi:membrane-bound ClpP family serine protease